MKLKDDHKGFSLVELIVVMGIVAILSSLAFNMVGYLKHANTEKTIQTISMALSKQQASSMSKVNRPYLYIYQVSDVYYIMSSTTNYSTFNTTAMTASNGTDIGSGFTIKAESSLGTLDITGTNFIKVCYKRDGSFDMGTGGTNCSSILVVSPRITNRIKLIQVSGKHLMSVE